MKIKKLLEKIIHNQERQIDIEIRQNEEIISLLRKIESNSDIEFVAYKQQEKDMVLIQKGKVLEKVKKIVNN